MIRSQRCQFRSSPIWLRHAALDATRLTLDASRPRPRSRQTLHESGCFDADCNAGNIMRWTKRTSTDATLLSEAPI